MEFESMNMEQVETRIAEIKTMLTAEDADIEALSAETDKLLERKAAIKAAAEEKRSLLQKVAASEDKPIEVHEEKEERKTMDSREIRNSKAYIDAYVDYIKGKNDGEECRSLLTENAENGTVPVPTYIEDRIQTAWDNDSIMSRVKRTYFKGNLKVGVEMSATSAYFHSEGDTAGVPEEQLVLKIVELVPETIKKWITISDEVMDMRGQAFLDYIYDEIEYQIVKLAAINSIYVATKASKGETPLVGTYTAEGSTLAISDIIKAQALLGDAAQNRVIVLSPADAAALRIAALNANYAIDPFMGLTVIELELPSNSSFIALIGDLSAIQANFPNGDQPTFKFDDLSLAEKDLVKVVGRMPFAADVVRAKSLVVVNSNEGH